MSLIITPMALKLHAPSAHKLLCILYVCVHLFPPLSFVCYTFSSSSFSFSSSLLACVFSSVAVSSCELSDEGRYVIMYVFQGSQQKNKLYYCDLEAISYKINGESCTCTPYISTTCTCKCTTFFCWFSLLHLHCIVHCLCVYALLHFLFSYTCICFFIFFLLVLFILILFPLPPRLPLLSYLSLLFLVILFLPQLLS